MSAGTAKSDDLTGRLAYPANATIAEFRYYTHNLYPFQDAVLKIIRKADDTFYLAGGTVLGRHYLQHRYSDGLDFFVNRKNNFRQLANKIIGQLQDHFSEIEIVLLGEDFVRIFIHNEEYRKCGVKSTVNIGMLSEQVS